MAEGNSLPHIDPVGVVESWLHSIFIGVFNDEGAKHHLGFSRISPFYSDDGVPGWNLWFDETSGAYGITIFDAVLLEAPSSIETEAPLVGARIQIAYYPDPEETVFESFSWFEKIARVGPLFDGTGTPSTEGRKQLNENFFALGYMDLLLTPGGRLLELITTAPELWMDRRPEGLLLIDSKGDPFRAVAPEGRDRRVPGWQLASFLLDKIVSGFLYCQRLAPYKVRAREFSMPEFVISDEPRFETKFDAGLKGFSLCLVPESRNGDAAIEKLVLLQWQNNLQAIIQLPEGHETASWFSMEPDFSSWGLSDWWEVKNLHFHEHEAALCACYVDH